jgi:hypothetical protein
VPRENELDYRTKTLNLSFKILRATCKYSLCAVYWSAANEPFLKKISLQRQTLEPNVK